MNMKNISLKQSVYLKWPSLNEEEPFDLIELYDELTIEGLANDPILKKHIIIVWVYYHWQKEVASLKGKEKHDLEYQTNVKRVTWKRNWGEMSPATRHQEYLEKYYTRGQFASRWKSKNEIYGK